MFEHLVLFALVTWLALPVLVWFDAAARGARRNQWAVVVAVAGLLGFAMYVLFVVSPPESA